MDSNQPLDLDDVEHALGYAGRSVSRLDEAYRPDAENALTAAGAVVIELRRVRGEVGEMARRTASHIGATEHIRARGVEDELPVVAFYAGANFALRKVAACVGEQASTDPGREAERAQMLRLATDWEERAAKLREYAATPVARLTFGSAVDDDANDEAATWETAARELRAVFDIEVRS